VRFYRLYISPEAGLSFSNWKKSFNSIKVANMFPNAGTTAVAIYIGSFHRSLAVSWKLARWFRYCQCDSSVEGPSAARGKPEASMH